MGLAFLYVIVNFLTADFLGFFLALLLYANENIPEKRLLWIRRSLLLSWGL
jgi:hypothetical protein